MNRKEWMAALLREKKPLPLLSFPAASLLGVSVYDFTHDASLQAKGIAAVASRVNSAASVTMMDLSVEAEAFGCTIHAPADEVPTVTGVLLQDEEDAAALAVPAVGAGRTGLYVEAARLAKESITDRPVFAGIIGPFSLAGRLMDVSEALVNCLAEPDFVLATLEKTTEFLAAYAAAYKKAGLDGIVMAEPLAGLLSPALEKEFSAPFVKRIIDGVQDDSFAVIYHNCGPNTPDMLDSLASLGASAYHFGDAVSMETILARFADKLPAGVPVMGNISPSAAFAGGSAEEMAKTVKELLTVCSPYENFHLSSGCDIPPAARWENIDAFFRAAEEFYHAAR